jgi:outer membrane protein assembly factor BamB
MKKSMLAAVCIIFLSSLVLIPFAKADWTMFRGDLSHNGVGTGDPVLTPNLLWKFNAGGAVYSSPTVVNGIVYIGSENGNFFALNATNSFQIWNYSTGNTPGIWSSPAVVNNVVYVGGGSITYAFDAFSGAVLWNYNNGGTQPISSSPAVANGIVYIGSSDTPQGGFGTIMLRLLVRLLLL